MKKNFIFPFILCLAISLFFSCSSDDEGSGDDYGNVSDGYALKKAEGHSFQFYNSTKWIFSVAVRDGEIYPELQEGCVETGDSMFDYKKDDFFPNKAECWVSISYRYVLASGSYYGGYIGRMELTFTSPTKGTYKIYDAESDKLGSSGKFTVDSPSSLP